MRGKFDGKAERALALREIGIEREAIAERLGTTVHNVDNLINVAKKRRAKDRDAEQLARDVLECARAI
jgi:transcriptional regulator